VIVVDDGSSDGTIDMLEGPTGSHGLTLRVAAQPHKGPAAARNRAVSGSSGELLAFLDADDLWLPSYLDRMVQLHDESKTRGVRAGVLTCDARILGPDGYLAQTYMELMHFPSEVTLARMLVSNPVFVGALSTRGLVDEAGGFCPELFGTEDYDLWLRIVERGYRIVARREALTVYRLRPASVSANLARMARSLQLTYLRALERDRLTPRQRRIALRQLRLQRALEQVGLMRSDRRAGRLPLARLFRALPLFVRVAVENPDRWLTTVRVLAGRGSPLSQVVK